MRGRGLSVYKPEKTYDGYTLFAPLENYGCIPYRYAGNFVHRWQMPYQPGDYGYLLENEEPAAYWPHWQGAVLRRSRAHPQEVTGTARSCGSMRNLPCTTTSPGCPTATRWS